MKIMIEPLTLFSAFMLGLLGSSHCFGMCGGISSAFSMMTAPVGWKKVRYQLYFNTGRMFSYGCIGMVAGFLGMSFSFLLGHTGVLILRLFAGVLLVLMGFYVTGWWQGLRWLEAAGVFIWKFISPITRRFLPVSSPKKALLVGSLWGFLPCGLVYSTLALAITEQNSLEGGGLMVAFGLGTTPMMMAVGTTSRKMVTLLTGAVVKKIAGISVIIFGLWTLGWMIMPLVLSQSSHLPNHDHQSKLNGNGTGLWDVK